jgi:hypothetical protein
MSFAVETTGYRNDSRGLSAFGRINSALLVSGIEIAHQCNTP